MTIKHINPDVLGEPASPFSNVVETDDYVYLSGQAPIIPETGDIFSGTFNEEATLVFDNIKKLLESVGLTLKDVVKVNAYLGTLEHREEYNKMYRQYFKPPYPARTTIGCNLGGMKIEVDVIAYKKR